MVELAQGCGRADLVLAATRAAAGNGAHLVRESYPLPRIAGFRRDHDGMAEPALVLAVARQESLFDPAARSSAGAMGADAAHAGHRRRPCRASSARAIRSGRLVRDPDYNVRLGAHYLGQQLARFGNEPVMALAAYNAGPRRVTQWLELNGDPRGGDPYRLIDWIELIPFAETRNYVQRVLEGRGRCTVSALASQRCPPLARLRASRRSHPARSRHRDPATRAGPDPRLRVRRLGHSVGCRLAGGRRGQGPGLARRRAVGAMAAQAAGVHVAAFDDAAPRRLRRGHRGRPRPRARGLDITDPALRKRLLEAYRRLTPFADVVPALTALRVQGMRTAILSNGSAGMLAEAVAAAGIAALIDPVLSVDEVGVFKPAPEVYWLATLASACRPRRSPSSRPMGGTFTARHRSGCGALGQSQAGCRRPAARRGGGIGRRPDRPAHPAARRGRWIAVMTADLPVRFADVAAAAARLRGVAAETPLLESEALNERVGGRLLIKPEPLQRTGSFKFRGAYNAVSTLRPPAVVAYSSGNHAQGVAMAARLLGMPATIVMPADAPRTKLEGTRALGAEVITYDRSADDREAIGREVAERTGAVLIRPYDDPLIVAGQGTVGLELAEQSRPPRCPRSTRCSSAAAAGVWSPAAPSRSPARCPTRPSTRSSPPPSTTRRARSPPGRAAGQRAGQRDRSAMRCWRRCRASSPSPSIPGCSPVALQSVTPRSRPRCAWRSGTCGSWSSRAAPWRWRPPWPAACRPAGRTIGVVVSGGNVDAELFAQVLAAPS